MENNIISGKQYKIQT